MVVRSLEEHFNAQTEERRQDPGTDLGVPVAFLLKPEAGADFDYFRTGMRKLGGDVSQFMQHSTNNVVKISYPNRPKELWVHARENRYLDLYNEFCRVELGFELPNTYRVDEFAVDHSYNKSSVPHDVDAYIRLFIVKSTPNSSWGAYYEQRLKDLFIKRMRVGLRKETVAIRAKITGITAPLKGDKKERNIENISNVVNQMIALGMTTQSQFEIDCKTLAAFCGMADGNFVGMTASIDAEGKADVVPHSKVE